jgi:hypothetical protein
MLTSSSFHDPGYTVRSEQRGLMRSGLSAIETVGWGAAAVAAFFPPAWGFAATAAGVGLAATILQTPVRVGEYAGEVVSGLAQLGRLARRQEFGTPYVDTRAAFTMRQQGMRAMMDSSYSLRARLGGEASLFH